MIDVNAIFTTLTYIIRAFGPYIIGLLVAAAILQLWRRKLGLTAIDKRFAADRRLVNQAIAEVDVEAKRTYLEIVIGEELSELTNIYTRSAKRRLFLGSIYLLAGFASIGITGTKASVPGHLDTIAFSFWVNIIGEIASGFLIFGDFESKALLKQKLANEMRLETAQFIGQSSDYYGQPADQRWDIFTRSIESMLMKSYEPPNQSTFKQAEEEKPED